MKSMRFAMCYNFLIQI